MMCHIARYAHSTTAASIGKLSSCTMSGAPPVEFSMKRPIQTSFARFCQLWNQQLANKSKKTSTEPMRRQLGLVSCPIPLVSCCFTTLEDMMSFLLNPTFDHDRDSFRV